MLLTFGRSLPYLEHLTPQHATINRSKLLLQALLQAALAPSTLELEVVK
jgi:hypothetical protein